MSLYDATRSLHHEAERHPWGKRMAQGDLSFSEYADWLQALADVHWELDRYMPFCVQRTAQLMDDQIATLPERGRRLESALRFADSLTDPISIGGAAYILCGAHLRGGAVIRKRMEPKGFACSHLRFEWAKEANDWLTGLRDKEDLAPGARAAFRAIIEVMDEIEAWHGSEG